METSCCHHNAGYLYDLRQTHPEQNCPRRHTEEVPLFMADQLVPS